MLLLLLVHTALTWAAGGEAASDADDTLYLSVVINRQPRKQLVRAVERDGHLMVSGDDLRAVGLRWSKDDAASVGGEPDGFIAIGAVPGVSAVYEAGLQRLTLAVPVSMLANGRQRLEAGGAQPRASVDPATLTPGFYLNYNWYAQHQDDMTSLSVTSDLHVFGVVPGNLEQTVLTRAVHPASELGGSPTIRLDTSWTFDNPDTMSTVTLGDGVSGGLSWTRATRIGGLHFARNFNLQPYRVTTPLALFQGEATLPSTVDLFVNGIRCSVAI